jgi:hypothetical protein
LILSFDLAAALRRIKAQRHSGLLARRHDDDLPFVPERIEAGPELMLDTSVYIDVLQEKVLPAVEDLLVVRISNHSSICLAELTHLFSRLDPQHPETPNTIRELRGVIEDDIPHHRWRPFNSPPLWRTDPSRSLRQEDLDRGLPALLPSMMTALKMCCHDSIEHEGEDKGMEGQPEGVPELRLHGQHRLCSR